MNRVISKVMATGLVLMKKTKAEQTVSQVMIMSLLLIYLRSNKRNGHVQVRRLASGGTGAPHPSPPEQFVFDSTLSGITDACTVMDHSNELDFLLQFFDNDLMGMIVVETN
ncbi:hypothetical protein E2C01_078647 [Portunus trituberculatus]|uniref:Uncharacterized protein n=1 Tax=Portunus trituberculatus TaxID=210409 RepID=A0A5B7IUP0_PORTR|nr:hypothetical protein [Portunus trituberculatus]